MLNNIDFLNKPEKDELKERLKAEQEKLNALQMKIKEHKLPVLVLFEGWGSSGKGTLIGEVIHNIDPRFFKVATLKLPTEEELTSFCKMLADYRTLPREIPLSGFRLDG